jgi:hypothetical protein
MKVTKLILAIAAAAIAAPMANAGGDSVRPSAQVVSEKTAGMWQGPNSSSPIVSEKTAGMWQAANSSSPIASEKTAGLFPAQPMSTVLFAAPEGSGFDWSAAALGAGGTLAFLLAASTGAIALRRRGMVAH